MNAVSQLPCGVWLCEVVLHPSRDEPLDQMLLLVAVRAIHVVGEAVEFVDWVLWRLVFHLSGVRRSGGERQRQCACVHSIPVHSEEEGVIHHIADAAVAEALGGVLLEEEVDEVAGLLREERRKNDGPLHDMAEDGLREKRRRGRTFTELPLKGTTPTMS